MFRPVPMMRLKLVVLERDARAVLRSLAESGAVQLVSTKAGPETAPLAPRDHAAELSRCDRFLTRVEEIRRLLEIKSPIEPPAEATTVTLDQAGEKMRLMEESAGNLSKRRQQLLERWNQVTADWQQVSHYRGLEIPLGQPDPNAFLHFVTGTLPAENFERLQSEVGNNVALLPLPEEEGRQPLLAMTTRQGRDALENALQRTGFQHEVLPVVEGATTDSLSSKSGREREEVSAALEKLNAELRALADEYARPLAEIEALANVERRLLEAEQGFPRTEAAILITGWVPAADTSALEARVRRVTGDRCAIETTAPENLTGNQPPVLLRHQRLLRPFGMLVAAYGLPNYQELEPTLFVAISYVLMFGIMFGDAGHGAVLAAGGLIAMLAGRAKKLRDLGLLLLFGGLSSMVFGIIYGSWFGLAACRKYALWRDPLEGDPMTLMYGAIGIGVVMISLGLILNIINRFQRGDVIGGFLDKFGVVGVLFYWGSLVLITKFAALESRGLVSVAVVLFLVLPIVGWSAKEPMEYLLHRRADHPAEPGGGLFAAVTESLVGAFEAVLSYLANTISFVRLAAYAMSHAALLVAAFMLADAVRHYPVGGVLSVLVAILGNLVAIVLEGIIASVQALRLEYYEFFGKFFSGEGQAFKPFRLVAEETVSV